MPGTYSQILLHIVFSTKERRPWITSDLAEKLYPFIGGIVREQKGALLSIGGVEDHVHLYIRWRTDGTIADLMRNIKSRSSAWIHDEFKKLKLFAWQEGYSVFTVSKSREKFVKNYIVQQAKHHQRRTFKAELLQLLRAHEIEFDEKYVFE